MSAGFLIDTSAFIRLLTKPDVRAEWLDQLDAGVLAMCELTELEVLHIARSSAHRRDLVESIDGTYRSVVMPDRIYDRALNVQESLTYRGTHRAAGPVDLLVAATAEAHGLTLLHYDRDFERVAAVTGQSTRWLADPGSID
jgi:predicted nucleic acid-binding protein